MQRAQLRVNQELESFPAFGLVIVVSVLQQLFKRRALQLRNLNLLTSKGF